MIDISKIPLLLKNPASLKPALKDLVIDLSNDLQEWSYENHLVVIVGLPKSGTNWLWSMLCSIPGYNPCPGTLRPMKLTKQELWDHDLSQRMFDAIPKNKFTVIKTHTRPTVRNFELLEKNNAKTILLVRDLRNVAVSRFFHEKKDKNSWCYKAYNTPYFEYAFHHNLQVIIAEYVSWMRDWRKHYLTNRNMYRVYFECIENYFAELLSFLSISTEWVRVLEKNKNKKRLSNSVNKVLPARQRGTYSGMKRNWEEYFTKEQKIWFRNETEEVMKLYGYDWED